MINIRTITISCLLMMFFCASTVAQKINQVDSNGKRTGVWRKHYENGKIRYQGQFENGKEVGEFKFFDKGSSIPSITKEFSRVSDTAVVKFYNRYGELGSKGKMVGKSREGRWFYYFTNSGVVMSEENYLNGKLHGVVRNYYKNGKMTEEAIYKNNIRNGYSKVYTESGSLIEEVSYLNGKLEGEGKYYDLKGQLKEKGMYKDGKRSGKWEYYMDGELVNNRPKRKTHSIPKQR